MIGAVGTRSRPTIASRSDVVAQVVSRREFCVARIIKLEAKLSETSRLSWDPSNVWLVRTREPECVIWNLQPRRGIFKRTATPAFGLHWQKLRLVQRPHSAQIPFRLRKS